MKYYEINEEMAKRAKGMWSFSDYKQGSATAEYREMVDDVYELGEEQKKKVDVLYHDKIDSLVNKYAYKLAQNMNKGFEIECRCPSVLIAGPANFPVKKKEAQNRARDANMEEYKEIRAIKDKIESVGTAGISADNPTQNRKSGSTSCGYEKGKCLLSEK